MADEGKYLWAPWRMGYIRTEKNEFGPCLFCDKSLIGKDEENLVVHRGEHAYVLLNLYPYNNGHLMVSPYEHEKNFDKLAVDTQVEMMNLMSQSMNVLRRALNADGFNFGANFGEVAGAGIKEHLHLHLVPRWIGDTNFMPVMGHTKVMVDGLKETRSILADEFLKNTK
jgi:ATP adenylyltransferase|tara:strand:- start:102 stop:608 length:507 start_codon:yes stop_codon:yes gene_type:complete